MNEYICKSCGHKSNDGVHSCPGLVFTAKPITKTKYAMFELVTGDIYGYPLERIAHDRASYYTKKDSTTTYQQEFDFVMNDTYEGIDWLQNNMNPEDKDFVVIQHAPKLGVIDRIKDELEDSYISEK